MPGAKGYSLIHCQMKHAAVACVEVPPALHALLLMAVRSHGLH